MKITSEIIKKAQNLRVEAAIRFDCEVEEIDWQACVAWAIELAEETEIKEKVEIWFQYMGPHGAGVTYEEARRVVLEEMKSGTAPYHGPYNC